MLSMHDDDGSCYTSGCMDPAACDFNPLADTAECTTRKPAMIATVFALLMKTVTVSAIRSRCWGADLAGNNPDGPRQRIVRSCHLYCGKAQCGMPKLVNALRRPGDGGIGGYGGACFGDDADGQRGTSDLLMWLGVYGYACD